MLVPFRIVVQEAAENPEKTREAWSRLGLSPVTTDLERGATEVGPSMRARVAWALTTGAISVDGTAGMLHQPPEAVYRWIAASGIRLGFAEAPSSEGCVLAGLDTSVLVDVRLLGLDDQLSEVLSGRGWTTSLVDEAFHDPLGGSERGVGCPFPFLEVDPVDVRLLSGIERDQVAVAGLRKASQGAMAGEASLVHVARQNRPGSILLSNDPCTVALGRRRGLSVRGTLYPMHRACRDGLLTAAEAWEHHGDLLLNGRSPPRLTKEQLDEYLQTGTDPRG